MNLRLLQRPAFVAALLGAAIALAAGCTDDDFDHQPPAGMGCIIVNNLTTRDINVFINGVSTNQAREGKDRAYDLHPGVYRVILDQEDGDRNYRDDIDVLVDRRTIMEVTDDPLRFDSYDVFIYFD